jgi:flagellar motor switch protein FliN/FliY
VSGAIADRLMPHLEACAQTGASELPVEGVQVGNIVAIDDPTTALPLGGVRLLCASVVGPFAMDVVLALADPFALRMGGAGPTLIAQCAPALQAVVRGMAVLTDLPFDLEDIQEVPLGTPWGDPGTGFFTSGLFLDEEQVGNILFLVPPGAGLPAEVGPAAVVAAEFPEADEDAPDPDALAMLRGVEMRVTAELGRTRLPVAHLLELTSGSVVELDRVAGAPVDVLVNGTVIAKGEVVVVDEEYGVRITEILGVDEA